MKNNNQKYKIHIKNNKWAKGSFPNTPEAEKVFTITDERFQKTLSGFPKLKDQVESFIDWDEDNFATSMTNTDILLTWNLPTSNLSELAPKLKWIHCIGAGVEHLLPLDWMPNGVVLTNNKGVHARKSGEYGLMAILMLHNHLPAIINNQRIKNYEQLFGTPISNSTIVIVGTGSLGGAVAQLLEPLGPKVIGVNRQGSSVKGCSEIVTIEKLDDVLPHADILYMALPETPETLQLIDRRRLNLLKHSCGIVNVGRQSAIDYQALSEMLESGRLAGAILDVFNPEPIVSDSPYWNVPNLIITPHVSSDELESYIPLTLNLFFKNLELFLSNKPLVNQVNKELGY
jgi:phosphoglycerate dehydrogenase-like enzyme|tara:strand:- start:287 stop:1318 length:1032 start_codon:yes stop_codon:yes gene_type:complete